MQGASKEGGHMGGDALSSTVSGDIAERAQHY